LILQADAKSGTSTKRGKSGHFAAHVGKGAKWRFGPRGPAPRAMPFAHPTVHPAFRAIAPAYHTQRGLAGAPGRTWGRGPVQQHRDRSRASLTWSWKRPEDVVAGKSWRSFLKDAESRLQSASRLPEYRPMARPGWRLLGADDHDAAPASVRAAQEEFFTPRARGAPTWRSCVLRTCRRPDNTKALSYWAKAWLVDR